MMAMATPGCKRRRSGSAFLRGGDVGLVVGRLAALYLLLALGILDEAVEFLLTFGGVYVDTAEAAWFTGGEERHVLLMIDD